MTGVPQSVLRPRSRLLPMLLAPRRRALMPSTLLRLRPAPPLSGPLLMVIITLSRLPMNALSLDKLLLSYQLAP